MGEQVEPGGRPKAPGRLELLQRFVNSYNHDLPREWDRIGTAEKARVWLREKGLIVPGDRVSGADAARLRQLREAIRALAVANQGERPDAAALGVIRSAAAAAPLRLEVDDGGRSRVEAAGAASTVRSRRSSGSSTRRS